MKKTIAMHEEKKSKKKKEADVPDGAIPAYLMERCVARRCARAGAALRHGCRGGAPLQG